MEASAMLREVLLGKKSFGGVDMAKPVHFLAMDLGAESGRGMLGTLDKGKLFLSEVHRFLTGAEPVPTIYPEKVTSQLGSDQSLLWDFVRFWAEIKTAIKKVVRQQKKELSGIGVDTWGVDFALLDRNGGLISSPYNYRDTRTNGMMEEAFKRMPKEKIFEYTGIQFMTINTLYHLLSLVVNKSPILEIADKFLTVPDLLNYWFTGKAVAEFTEASTTQCFDPRKRNWSDEVLSAMGIPRRIFPQIIPPGTVIGPMRPSVAEEVGANIPIIAPACHDTSSAIAAVPAKGKDFAWISSGTWSIVGINTPEPVINEQSFKYNLTNEGGVNGTYRFSKNVMGLWVVQNCRAQWKDDGKEYSYDELTKMAAEAPLLKSIVDPDYEGFLRPGKAVDLVKEYCQKTKQPIPQTDGEVVRAVLQGLALRYRYVLESIEKMSNRHMDSIHIVGGGTQNKLLSQFTADALGRKVVTGPVEATAIGNLIVQAIATGAIPSWQAGVEVIEKSFEILTFIPGDNRPWNEAYDRFLSYLEKIQLAF